MNWDVRDYIARVQAAGQLKEIKGADWDLEIGCLTSLLSKQDNCPAIIFDEIKDYPKGFRLLTAPTSNPVTLCITFGLPVISNTLELLEVLRQKLPVWQGAASANLPTVVKSGPVMENVYSGKDIDLFKFPTPRWNELDGGRYIGTGDAIITRDPDDGWTNVGTYRVMVHDKNTLGFHMSPGKHGRIHYEKLHARGKPCPIAVSIGHHPLVYRVGCLEFSPGIEYGLLGAIAGSPVPVIQEDITGLPIPADAEAVIVGWCPPNEFREEGPFGEWTGYYASKGRPAPIINVERIYHRNNPVMLGSCNAIPPHEDSYYHSVMRSTVIYSEMIQAGIPDVRAVWLSNVGGRLLITLSIKQRYAGHAKQAALIASQSTVGAYMGRYVIVVDEDIDPTDTQEVLWALCTRSDPEKDIDIIRRAWSTPLDPIIRKPATAFMNSRAIIDACKPYEWMDEFPQEIKIDEAVAARVMQKWGDILKS
ncbi:MAG: UbiD family decarboxylase [Dehalococcoidia bacterium]|nr:UbiD family decarboxylase [Dehalococcoidia bacterium]